MKVLVEKVREGAQIPEYAREGDAGMDVKAAEDVYISPGETKIVPSGLKFAIPEGYEIQVRPRSGISLKTPLRIANSPGTIDSGYRGEFGVIVSNISVKGAKDGEIYTLENGENQQGTYKIKKGDRIAQIILQRVEKIVFEEGDVTQTGTDRGGGFGSTGIGEKVVQ